MRRLVPWLVLLALLTAPTAALIHLGLLADDIPPELEVLVEPVLTEPTLRIREGRMDAVLEFDVSPGPMIRAGGSGGVVTSVAVETGDEIAAGDVLYSVDRVEVRAMSGDAPLHRALALASRGPDVLQLNNFLSTEGLLHRDPNDIFDQTTAAAVRAYEEAIGVVRPSGVFTPGLVVWLPEVPFVVGDVLIAVGSAAPALGEPIAQGVPSVMSVQFVGADGERLRFEGVRSLEVDGRDFGFVDGSEGITADLLARVLARDGGTQLQSENGSWSVAVVLRLPEALQVLVVPSSAVMVDAEGHETCIWASADSGTYEAVSVEPTGGTLGVTDVLGDIEGRSILANPLQVLEAPLCP